MRFAGWREQEYDVDSRDDVPTRMDYGIPPSAQFAARKAQDAAKKPADKAEETTSSQKKDD